MKCPDCKFVCSDLRDICPKCYVDLRPTKHQLGLPITNRQATYESLLAKVKPEAEATRSSPTPLEQPKSKTNIFSAFSGLFSSTKKTTSTPITSNAPLPPKTPEKAAQKQNLETAPLTPPVVEKVIEVPSLKQIEIEPKITFQNLVTATQQIEKEEFDLLPELDDLRINFETPNPASSKDQKTKPPPVLNEIPTSAGPKVLDFTNYDGEIDKILESLSENEVVSYEPVVDVEEKTTTNSSIPLIHTELTETIKTNERNDFPEGAFTPEQIFATPQEVEARHEEVEFTPLEQLPHTIDELFLTAQLEIKRCKPFGDLEFSAENFSPNAQKKQIELMFLMAHDALTDPGSEKKYSDEVTFSENRTVEVTSLVEQLARVEASINAPALGLKGNRQSGLPKRQSISTPEVVVQLPALEIAPLWRRLTAFSIDIFLAILLTALITIIFDGVSNEPYLTSLMIDAVEPNLLDSLQVLSTFITVLPILLILYFIFFLGLTGRTTPGLSVVGLKCCTIREEKISPIRAIIRILILPLSFVCFGYLPLIFGYETLHDKLAGTTIIKSKNEESEDNYSEITEESGPND